MNRYNPDIHHRQSIRLRGYDYSQAGAYFVTICTHARECLFGEIVDGEMRMNMFGEMVQNAWADLPNHYPNLVLDRFVVMPNHIHGVIVLVGAGLKPAHHDDADIDRSGLVGPGLNPRAGLKPAPTLDKRHGLPEIVREFKTFSARRINEKRNIAGVPIWQRNYYEHVIRDDADYNRIAEYIATNPQRWIEDKLHPENTIDDANVGAGLKPAHHDDADIDRVGLVGEGLKPRAGLKPAPTERGTTGRPE